MLSVKMLKKGDENNKKVKRKQTKVKRDQK